MNAYSCHFQNFEHELLLATPRLRLCQQGSLCWGIQTSETSLAACKVQTVDWIIRESCAEVERAWSSPIKGPSS